MKSPKKPTQSSQPVRVLTDDALRTVGAAVHVPLFHMPNIIWRQK
jgi:hypothetical protein